MPDEEIETTAEEVTVPEKLDVSLGEKYYNVNAGAESIVENEVSFIDTDGSFLLTVDGKIMGCIFQGNEEQIKHFKANYKKERQEIIQKAVDMIEAEEKKLEETKERIKAM